MKINSKAFAISILITFGCSQNEDSKCFRVYFNQLTTLETFICFLISNLFAYFLTLDSYSFSFFKPKSFNIMLRTHVSAFSDSVAYCICSFCGADKFLCKDINLMTFCSSWRFDSIFTQTLSFQCALYDALWHHYGKQTLLTICCLSKRFLLTLFSYIDRFFHTMFTFCQ